MSAEEQTTQQETANASQSNYVAMEMEESFIDEPCIEVSIQDEATSQPPRWIREDTGSQQYIHMEHGTVKLEAIEPSRRRPLQATDSMRVNVLSSDASDYVVHVELDENGGIQESPSWLKYSSTDYLGYSLHSKQQQSASRCAHWRAELVDLIRELLHYTKTKSWKKKVLTAVVCLSSLLVFVDLIFFGNIVRWLHAFVLWMENHIIEGIFAFVGIFTMTTLVFIPPSILTFACGYMMAQVCGILPGIIAATLACFIGSVLGAVIAFFRARYMMRDLVQLFARRYTLVRAVDKAIERNGFRVMLLLRLCPLIPFHALNYIGGITGVSWEAFTLSMFGILPSTILTTTIGATTEGLLASRGSEDQQLVKVLLICSGLAFVIIAMVITYYFARKELRLELEAVALLESSSEEDSECGAPSEVTGITTDEVEDEEWFWMFT